jgi:hypothetical protein
VLEQPEEEEQEEEEEEDGEGEEGEEGARQHSAACLQLVRQPDQPGSCL